MKPEDWRRVEEHYHAAFTRKASERSRFLKDETSGDEGLRREVESLLAFQDESESFLETNALEATVREVAGEKAAKDGSEGVLALLFSSELGEAPPDLLVTTPSGHARSVALEVGSLSLGRSPENDLSFPEDTGLSRRHLVIESAGDRRTWTVRDLGSKNGTLVNGTPLLGKHLLQPGDRVSASCVTLTYRGAKPVEG